MISYTYQLVSPQVFAVKYNDIELKDKVVIRPCYMAICHADQRYYLGKRDRKVMKKKLPMALIHECCGEVIYDASNTFEIGELVIPIPNIPTEESEIIYENYRKTSHFLSSGQDGFLREYIEMPKDRVVSAKGIKPQVAAITEYISVAVHAAKRFEKIAHVEKTTIGIWGDGGLAYCLASVLISMFPKSKIIVIGKNERKLARFSFVQNTFLLDDIPEDLQIDHAFECVGGEGSSSAIDDIIRLINPQGTVILMGVSENKVGINTRDILEKGLIFVGSSRSGREDFENAISLLNHAKFQKRLESIIFLGNPVSSVEDLHRVFETDLNTAFKTVFEWNM